MRKIISVGDLAGKRCWQDIDKEKYDHIVLLGDFPDPRDGISNEQVVDNLKNIIQFKKDNPNKVILILGNHDMRYLYLGDDRFRCSPCSSMDVKNDLHKLYNENIDLFQIAFQVKNYLYTHAGVTKQWWDLHVKKENTVADTINAMWKADKYSISQIGPYRGGHSQFGGPYWADSSELTEWNILPGYHQVVGHNRVRDITTLKKSNRTSITFTDVLDYQIKFHEVEISSARKDTDSENL